MTPKLVVLWTDAVLWLLLAGMVVYALRARGHASQRSAWAKVARDPAALCGGLVLALCLGVAMLDSLHFRQALAATAETSQVQAYSTRTESLLDVLMQRQIDMRETSYSAPLAAVAFTKDSAERDGQIVRVQPRLAHGGAHLKDADNERAGDIATRTGLGLLAGLGVWAALALGVCAWFARAQRLPWRDGVRLVAGNHTTVPLRAALITLLVLALLAGPAWMLAGHYHLLGTDRTGNDVFYQAMKSLRTAFVIGTLATLATLPLAVVLGVVAGYFKGWLDEVIQYLYTALTSVPNVLLIAACVLMMQVFIDQHPELFETGAERADLRLFLLCVILGLTGWATLCRLLRAETMKLRELDHVQAAVAFGAGPVRIMWRHIVPNVMHLVIITTVLDFSALILYEAVLSYVGVGVDPSMNSFGGMINLARSEMSRDPVVWWSFAAAFGFMVAVVLAANLFADGVRDAFNPRARAFRPRRNPPARPRAVEAAPPNREASPSTPP